jgi:hypothetical protein
VALAFVEFIAANPFAALKSPLEILNDPAAVLFKHAANAPAL